MKLFTHIAALITVAFLFCGSAGAAPSTVLYPNDTPGAAWKKVLATNPHAVPTIEMSVKSDVVFLLWGNDLVGNTDFVKVCKVLESIVPDQQYVESVYMNGNGAIVSVLAKMWLMSNTNTPECQFKLPKEGTGESSSITNGSILLYTYDK